jgi:hypothetical protein
MSTCDPKALEKGGCEFHYCLILGSIFFTGKSCQKVRKLKIWNWSDLESFNSQKWGEKEGKSPKIKKIIIQCLAINIKVY